MTIEQLKALLEAGKITQEEYDAKVKEIEGGSDDNKDFDMKAFLESDEFKKLLQSEVDKVRTKYSTDKKNLEDELQKLKQSNMSKEDILIERENSLKEAEQKLQKRELEFETLKVLEEKNLPSTLLDFITGDDMEARKEKIDQLSGYVDEVSSKKSEEKFKSQGRDFEESKGGNGDKKWEEMSIDERIEFAEKNPTEAEKYL